MSILTKIWPWSEIARLRAAITETVEAGNEVIDAANFRMWKLRMDRDEAIAERDAIKRQRSETTRKGNLTKAAKRSAENAKMIAKLNSAEVKF